MKISVLGKKPKTFLNIKEVKLKKKIFSVKITKKLHNDFVRLSGDNSPIHTNKKFAIHNGFRKPMCHGFLITTILSKIYGKFFPGGSELCISQSLFFRAPFYVGDRLKIEIIPVKKNLALKILETDVRIFCKRKLILSGETKFVLVLKN